MRNCDTCRFRQDRTVDLDNDWGWCHRFPPIYVGGDTFAFPLLKLTASCGEHRFAIWRMIRRLFGRKD